MQNFIRLSLALTLVLTAGDVLASFYPPGYAIENSCQEQGPVKVCATNHHSGNYPRLTITYQGQLIEKSWGKISVSARLNGREGQFKMQNQNYAEYAYLNNPQAYLCYAGKLPAHVTEGPYKVCSFVQTPQEHLVWEVHPVAAEEASLFFYARNEFGIANAWDLELAFVTEDQHWDTLNGANYRFRFE